MMGIENNDGNLFSNNKDGQDVVINSEVVDAVYSDDINNDSHIGSMREDSHQDDGMNLQLGQIDGVVDQNDGSV